MCIAGCKEETVIKAKVAPGDNNLGTVSIDTMTVITKTFFIDKLITSGKITGLPIIQGLGTIIDPFFGKTNAGIYFQVLPTTNDFNFSANAYTIDSAVLILPYSGFSWGNRATTKTQKIRVYRVNEAMDGKADYYSNQEMQIGTDILGEAVLDFKSMQYDTPVVAGKNTGFKHLRIPLSQAFVNEVVSNIGTQVFSNEANFLDRFKGFYVAPDSTTNMNNNTDLLPYILVDGGADYQRLAIAFYYHDNGSTEGKTAFFNFNGDKTACFGRITRNYNGYPAASLVHRYAQTINTSDDTLLLQNEPGTSIDIRIPYVGQFSNVSILKAELVLTQISSGTQADTFQQPNRITPVRIDATGAEVSIQDYAGTDVNANVAFVDGNKKTERDASGNEITVYRINIPRELQKAIIDKRNELHLRIKGTRGFPGAYRFVAGGRNHSTYKTQLNIVYSKPY